MHALWTAIVGGGVSKVSKILFGRGARMDGTRVIVERYVRFTDILNQPALESKGLLMIIS